MQQKIQEERERISRELHDNIGANLTSIITGLEISKKFSEKGDQDNLSDNITALEEHTRNTIDELRQTIWSLHENVTNIGDLNEKIKEYLLHRIKLNEEPQVKFGFDGDDKISVSSVEALHIFRIIQEAVNNAIKYAESTAISVELKLINGELLITVTDNGKGFNPEKEISREKKFGLKNMPERANKIKAKLSITSDTGKGTTVKLIKLIN